VAQRDWNDFFDRTDKQRQARRGLIERLSDHGVDRRVVELLLALDELGEVDGNASNLHNGTLRLSVPISVIAWKLGKRSETTVKSYIDLASATPYLAVSPSKHRSHTYLVRWLAIVDSEPGDEMPVGGCQTVAGIAHGTSHSRGPIRGPTGSVRGSMRGPTGPQSGGQLAPSLAPSLVPGIQNPGIQRSASKDPGLPGGGGGQLRNWPPDVWRIWRLAIGQRKLTNPDHVEELYHIAVNLGFFIHSEDNRFHVFAQAVHDASAKKPGAFFRENVAFARWYANCDEQDAAVRLMARVGRHEELPAHDEIQEQPLDRQNQIDKLDAWTKARQAMKAGR
jgi:hypothetical protein